MKHFNVSLRNKETLNSYNHESNLQQIEDHA